jgi:nitronate monooxygenase
MIHTKLTERFSLKHPIISAPMAFAATGKLASAVSDAGGLGLIGGGYGNLEWIKQQFSMVDPSQVGCGLITWKIEDNLGVLEEVLNLKPRAFFLSFGNPKVYAKQIKDSNIPLICQVQTLEDARNALACGADIIVAQGCEAGGHGEKRSTLTLVPEVADLIANQYPQVLLCAAGGIADGRGLAAALMLGADGVVIGSRFWASKEANVFPDMHNAAVASTGDNTIRTKVMDIARHIDWPERYTARVLKNDFTDCWHNNLEQLIENSEVEAQKWQQAWEIGDPKKSNTFVGEAAGIINEICSVDTIIHNISNQAEKLLGRQWE